MASTGKKSTTPINHRDLISKVMEQYVAGKLQTVVPPIEAVIEEKKVEQKVVPIPLGKIK